jgi:hypothetical protein
MKALEFKSKIKNNQILIPVRVQSELKTNMDIRVIVLFDDSENSDDLLFQDEITNQFLQGYAESDAIYDNY